MEKVVGKVPLAASGKRLSYLSVQGSQTNSDQ